MRFASRARQSRSRKKGCSKMAASPPWPTTHPKRRLTFFVMNYWLRDEVMFQVSLELQDRMMCDFGRVNLHDEKLTPRSMETASRLSQTG